MRAALLLPRPPHDPLHHVHLGGLVINTSNSDSLFLAGMNLRRNNRSGRHFLPEADVQKYYIGGRAGAGGPGPRRGPRRTGAPHRGRAGDREGATGAASAAGPGSPAAGGRGGGPGWVLRPRGAGTGQPGRAAALGGRGSDAAASPFSCLGPCSSASSSSSPGPRRRLSLGAPPASPLHQGRADPQGPSRKVRGCCRSPQLLVAIFNPPPPPPPAAAFSTSRWLPD